MQDANEDINFLQNFRNAVVRATSNQHAYVEHISNKVELAPNMFYVSALINVHYVVNCIVLTFNPYNFQLFFTLEGTKFLLLQPTIEEMNTIVRNHYGIGHTK